MAVGQDRSTSARTINAAQSLALVVLRLIVGWHFLCEGLAKLSAPDWSAADYLNRSNWVFAPLFRWMTAEAARLRVIDLLNIWGLILIGLGLLVGFLPRLASLCGMLLLVMYYVVFSPWHGAGYGPPGEGNYFVVNKILVEAAALLLLALFPAGSAFRLDRLVFGWLRRGRGAGVERAASPVAEPEVATSLARRRLVGGLASLPLLGLFFAGWHQRQKADRQASDAISGATIKVPEARLADLKGEMPRGRIGDLQISRLILGSNLIGGWAHARDLIYVSSLFKAYNTERKVIETLALAERAGINMINCVVPQLALVRKYNQVCGGKMQTMCQIRTVDGDLKKEIDLAIEGGTTTMYIQGAVGDTFVEAGRLDELAQAIEHGRRQGYKVGMGAHSIRVPMVCEEKGLDCDYYVKTFHHDRYWSASPREQRREFSVDRNRNLEHDLFHDNIFDLFPEQTTEFMAKVGKPFVAFKVLAAGAIPPAEGFRFAFENGADFICVGMFDFQIIEDVNIALEVLAELPKRQRPWLA